MSTARKRPIFSGREPEEPPILGSDTFPARFEPDADPYPAALRRVYAYTHLAYTHLAHTHLAGAFVESTRRWLAWRAIGKRR